MASELVLDDREAVHEGVPAVDDLEAERDLVLPLEVALPVRIAEADQFDREITLDAPADAALEVADDRARGCLDLSNRHTVRNRRRICGSPGAFTRCSSHHWTAATECGSRSVRSVAHMMSSSALI